MNVFQAFVAGKATSKLSSVLLGLFSLSEPSDLNYVEDTGGGPDLSVALNVNLDEISVLQVGCSAIEEKRIVL